MSVRMTSIQIRGCRQKRAYRIFRKQHAEVAPKSLLRVDSGKIRTGLQTSLQWKSRHPYNRRLIVRLEGRLETLPKPGKGIRLYSSTSLPRCDNRGQTWRSARGTDDEKEKKCVSRSVAHKSRLLPNDERRHPYQRGRASITGLGLWAGKVIETERLVEVALARLVELSRCAAVC
jgi:hypothetical protein